MPETASPETAQPLLAAFDPEHDQKNAPNGSPVNGLSNDPFDDSSSELSDVDLTTNGLEDMEDAPLLLHDDEPPSKKRRTDATPPPPTIRNGKKIESPPWKKVMADGPTSYVEGGRRKSGRINLVLAEETPDRKPTARRGHQAAQDSSPVRARRASIGQNAVSRRKSAPGPSQTPKTASKRPGASKPARASLGRATRKRSSSPAPTRQSARARRPARGSFDDEPAAATNARGWLRSRPDTIPLTHPGQIPKAPKLGPTFEEYWERSKDIPVEEGGFLVSDEVYTEEQARNDALAVARIEQAALPGGLLSTERCSAFVPEPEEEPPRQWAHMDHLVRAATNFRKLMLAEQQRHRSQAKKIAEACRDAWLRRQPKSAEELEAEKRAAWIKSYQVVVRSVFGTWENVRAHINRQRIQEWQMEEQQRVKAALNEAVNLSEQKLQAQRGQLDSDDESDEDLEGTLDADTSSGESDGGSGANSDADGSGDEDDVMSSSDEDEVGDVSVDVADEGLTQEQLREKYANLPALAQTSEMPDNDATSTAVAGTDESSDESVDMDDDMGSTEEDSDEGSTAESDDGDDEDEPHGLMGMLFNKSELTKLGKEASDAPEDVDEPMTNGNGIHEDEPSPMLQGDEDDEPQLIPMPDEDDDVSTPVVNGVSDAGVNGTAPTAAPSEADHEMTDAPADMSVEQPTKSPKADAPSLPSPVTEPATGSPATGSHSPRTSETKPSDIETSSLVPAAKDATSPSVTPSVTWDLKTEVPFLLRGTLREYQHFGLDWLAGLYANNTNGILADEMGLGKTIQTIALLAHLACHHQVWGPHLVIVPTSVMLNWEMEFKKWCPGFKILAYYGTQEERKRKRMGWTNDDIWNVCITSYQLVLQDQQVFKRRRWHFMVLDEAHNIKNFKSQRWQTLLGFNTQARLLLTGTPLQNNLTELWSLLFFLMPSANGVGGFADLQEFHDWFQKPESQILENGRETMDDEARAIIAKLHKVLRPYLLRRLKADVEKQMPAKYEHVEFCRLSKRQRELYDGFLARTDTRDTLASGNYMSIINCLMQLRKVCNHPDLFVDRPIMTSLRQYQSVPAAYDDTNQFVQRTILADDLISKVNLGVINLLPTQCEGLSGTVADRISQLSLHRTLMELREAQNSRAQSARTSLDPSTAESNLAYLESLGRWRRFEELQHIVYLNALRGQQRPIYGKSLVDFLTLGVQSRPRKPRPRVPSKILQWFTEDSGFLQVAIRPLDERAASMETTIQKFAFVTPAVVTRDMSDIILGRRAAEAFSENDLRLSAPVRWAPFMDPERPVDPWHEARMRLSVQFPDKRLLQYDCGKLQALDKLLRRLQSGGHRALIFTQMTKVLDILEQFLNIHGHKYLRLDGSTKVEQRQILTDRFNNDPRILCFILSSRSGGLGINLTGADTVIFYDQDWNPAMDKQCQDRCHRIGQTRDVHIYRLVSEHTIEANILRKASQKQMLDDVVIQEGSFTTDYFNKMSVRDVVGEDADLVKDGMDAANAAMDRLLGGVESNDGRNAGKVFEQAEDQEDVAAAKAAEREIQADDADFQEKSGANSGASSTRQGTPRDDRSADMSGPGPSGLRFSESAAPDEVVELNAWGTRMQTIDDFMLRLAAEQLKGTPLDLPKENKKNKKKRGKDTRRR
ncbi:SNF2 family domain-containing protein [Plectosphaerella cucumerina]|uniref:DNA helicase n=1 Tax=Plectosphaerella cucumerina TaxID=40658 RepID=A0A8K0TLF7_9PEZI|nr:SNF2 family domain-containing protein [Plectosphaerella cucumerina]